MGWLVDYLALENACRQSAVRRAQMAEASAPSPEPLKENARVKPKDTGNVPWRPKKVICFDRRDGTAFVVEINDCRGGPCSGQAPKPAHSDVEDSDNYRSALIRYLTEKAMLDELWSSTLIKRQILYQSALSCPAGITPKQATGSDQRNQHVTSAVGPHSLHRHYQKTDPLDSTASNYLLNLAYRIDCGKIRAWEKLSKLETCLKPLALVTLLSALPKVAAKGNEDGDGNSIRRPPVNLVEDWIEYSWTLTAPAIPVAIALGGAASVLWTIIHKPRILPQLLTVTAPVCGLVYLTLRSTAAEDVLLTNIVGSLWATVWLNMMCRAYLALAQPQAYCWLSFLVGAMIYMSLTMTDWINEEMDIGHKIFMSAECVTVASALLPQVLDRKPATSLLPK